MIAKECRSENLSIRVNILNALCHVHCLLHDFIAPCGVGVGKGVSILPQGRLIVDRIGIYSPVL